MALHLVGYWAQSLQERARVLDWCNITWLPGGDALPRSILLGKIELFDLDLHSHGVGAWQQFTESYVLGHGHGTRSLWSMSRHTGSQHWPAVVLCHLASSLMGESFRSYRPSCEG